MPQGEKMVHESFGMLGFGRVQSSKPVALFGSSIKHSNTIRMTVKTAKKERELNKDWYYGDQELIEIEMSYSQFAEAITSHNRGDGIPVTIRRFNGKMMEDCPEENKRLEFENEFKEKMKNLGSQLQKLTEEAKSILSDKKAPTKGDKELILSQIKALEGMIQGSLPFIYSSWNEQMDKTVLEAKGEVEAFVQNTVQSHGIQGLQAELLQLQEKNNNE